jgi:hypothetical protein
LELFDVNDAGQPSPVSSIGSTGRRWHDRTRGASSYAADDSSVSPDNSRARFSYSAAAESPSMEESMVGVSESEQQNRKYFRACKTIQTMALRSATSKSSFLKATMLLAYKSK